MIASNFRWKLQWRALYVGCFNKKTLNRDFDILNDKKFRRVQFPSQSQTSTMNGKNKGKCSTINEIATVLQLTPCSGVLLEKPVVAYIVKNFLTFL